RLHLAVGRLRIGGEGERMDRAVVVASQELLVPVQEVRLRRSGGRPLQRRQRGGRLLELPGVEERVDVLRRFIQIGRRRVGRPRTRSGAQERQRRERQRGQAALHLTSSS